MKEIYQVYPVHEICVSLAGLATMWLILQWTHTIYLHIIIFR